MDIKNFFSFGSKFVSSTIQTHIVDLHKLKNVPAKYSIQDKLMKGEYNDINFPVVFKQKYGKKVQDILDTGTVSLCLISDKFKAVLESENLTGWKTFPIKILDKKEIEIPGYHGLSITGRCSQILYGKGEIVEKRLVPKGPLSKYYKGLQIDLDKWDGSDFFVPEGSLWIIVTTKTADALRKAKLTNVRLENLADIEIDEFTVLTALKNQRQ
jgi:hypothetical protein